jgi:hypothetical protein
LRTNPSLSIKEIVKRKEENTSSTKSYWKREALSLESENR